MDSSVTRATAPRDCPSGVRWEGMVADQAPSAVEIQVCINSTCLAQVIPVCDGTECRVYTTRGPSFYSEAEAVQAKDGLIVAGTLWAELRPADYLQDGDTTSLRVKAMDMTLFERQEVVTYTDLSRSDVPCKQASFQL